MLKIIALGIYAHWCPGCKAMHQIDTNSTGDPQHTKWHFNGNYVRPSFAPGMDITSPTGKRCRYIVSEGWLHFGVESHHKFAGHSAPMTSIPQSHVGP